MRKYAFRSAAARAERASQRKQRAGTVLFTAALLVTATGCQTTQGGGGLLKDTFASDDPCANNARNIGLIAGTLIGGIVGHKIDKRAGTLIGAAAGGLIGGTIGHDMDRRRCELATIARNNRLDLVVQNIAASQVAATPESSAQARDNTEAVGMSVTVIDRGEQFTSGAARPTAAGIKAFGEMADAYGRIEAGQTAGESRKRRDAMRILLVGHTDDTGSSAGNAELSEARAREVARIFESKGFSSAQIFYQGAGETLPIADNKDDAGRAKNRRVEIIDLSDDAALAAYLANRRPNMAFYRPADAPAGSAAVAHAPAASDKPVPPSTSARPASGPVPKSQGRNTSHPTPAAPTAPAVASSARATTADAAPAAKPAAVTSQRGPVLNFGGSPVTNQAMQVDIGGMKKAASPLSLISSAYANDTAPLGSCLQDRPRVANGVKSLSTQQLASLRTSDYLPGVYDSSWTAFVNGHLVALNNVAVLRDGGSPARKPDLLIYQDYKGDAKAKADFRANPDVNTYQGDKALLYRVFVGGPVQCMDIVIPKDAPRAAPQSNLIYVRAGDYYQVAFAPTLAK